MNKKVMIVEVGPRDGFQSVAEFIPTKFKLQIIEEILASGIEKMQFTSFINPARIPQMSDAEEIAKTICDKYPEKVLYALIPNFKGAQKAVRSGVKEVTTVISLSESHNKANVQKTKTQSLEEIERICHDLPDLKVMADIGTTFACPFEGEMHLEPLVDLLEKLHLIGIRDFTLCDTIGMAYPKQVGHFIIKTKEAFPDCTFGLHIHDTRNMGMLNTYVGIQKNISSVQTSLGGLGGCPFAPGASGNTATEDLVYLLEKENYYTGLDFNKLLTTAKKLHENVKGNYSGHHININNECTD